MNTEQTSKNIFYEIAGITKLAATAALDVKVNEVKNQTSNITNFTTTALTAVKNKIPDHSKYITTLEFNKLTEGNFAAR